MSNATLPRGGFSLPINGFDMYCEVEGEGPLLVWLPGAFAGVDRLRHLVGAFRERFTVLTADANGQGRSTLGPGPITYVSMTADLVSLMDRLALGQADFFGISDGGVCGLHMLIDFSHRVRSVCMSGTPYSHAAYAPAARQIIGNFMDMLSSGPTRELLEGTYKEWSPCPGRFLEMARRATLTWAAQPNFNQAMLSVIDKPTRVVTTNADEYIPHAELQRLADWIPSAKAVNIAGMPHVPVEHAAELALAVRQFVQELNGIGP